MSLTANIKPFTNEWVAGSCGHFPDTEAWYKSIDKARRAEVGAYYFIYRTPSGHKYELWFSARAREAFMKDTEAAMEHWKQERALSTLMSGLELNK